LKVLIILVQEGVAMVFLKEMMEYTSIYSNN